MRGLTLPDLTRRLQQRQRTNDSDKDLCAAQTQIEDLRKKLADETAGHILELASSTHANQEKTRQLSERQERLDSCEAKITSQSNTISRLTDQVQRKSRIVESQATRISQLHSKFTATEAALARANELADTAAQARDSAATRISQLEAKLTATEAALTRANELADTAAQARDSVNLKLSTTSQESKNACEKLTLERDELAERVRLRDAQLAEKEREFEAQLAATKKQLEAANETESRLQVTAEEKTRLQAQLDAREAELIDLRTLFKRHEEALACVSVEKAKLQKELLFTKATCTDTLPSIAITGPSTSEKRSASPARPNRPVQRARIDGPPAVLTPVPAPPPGFASWLQFYQRFPKLRKFAQQQSTLGAMRVEVRENCVACIREDVPCFFPSEDKKKGARCVNCLASGSRGPRCGPSKGQSRAHPELYKFQGPILLALASLHNAAVDRQKVPGSWMGSDEATFV